MSYIKNNDDDDDDGWVHGGKYVPPHKSKPKHSSNATTTPTTKGVISFNDSQDDHMSNSNVNIRLNPMFNSITDFLEQHGISGNTFEKLSFDLFSFLRSTLRSLSFRPFQHIPESLFSLLSWLGKVSVALLLAFGGILNVVLTMLLKKHNQTTNDRRDFWPSHAESNVSSRSSNNSSGDGRTRNIDHGNSQQTNEERCSGFSLSYGVKHFRESIFSPIVGTEKRYPIAGVSWGQKEQTQQQKSPSETSSLLSPLPQNNPKDSPDLSTRNSSKSPKRSPTFTPTSAFRNRSRTPNYSGGNFTPRSNNSNSGATTTRRVLFSETEHGEVSTEQFHYDKDLPASARKVKRSATPHPREERIAALVDDEDRSLNSDNSAVMGNVASPGEQSHDFDSFGLRKKTSDIGEIAHHNINHHSGNVTIENFKDERSCSNMNSGNLPSSSDASPETAVIRPSVCSASSKESNERIKTQMKPLSLHQQIRNDSIPKARAIPAALIRKERAFDGDRQQQEERSKKQHIERYGLLPSITPLSKRYGQMKSQHKEQQHSSDGDTNESRLTLSNRSPMLALKTHADNEVALTGGTTTIGNAASKNVRENTLKRKRRDLLGAASRLSRSRRARINGSSSNLPLLLLGRNHTPLKRRRERDMNSTEEWIWQAMNSDGNGGGKRGRWSDSADVSSATSTPPKQKQGHDTLATPPKTPAPAGFLFGSVTPAAKNTTSSALDSSVLGFSLHKKDDSKTRVANDYVKSEARPSSSNDVGAPAQTIKLGANVKQESSLLANPAEAPKGLPVGSATPGVDTAPSASNVPTSSGPSAHTTQASMTPSFTFGASAPTDVVQEAKSIPVATTASTSAPSFGSITPGTKFTLGESAQAGAAQVVPTTPVAPAATFSFGGTSTPAPTEGAAAPTFSFGGASTPAPTADAATPTFSFGGASTPAPTAGAATPAFSFGGASTPASTAGAATPAFSFGGTSTPASTAGAATPAFSFGGTPGSVASTFVASGTAGVSTGTGTGGASARRRAARASGRRK